MKNRIIEIIEESINLKNEIIRNHDLCNFIETTSKEIINCINNNGKLLICGNGGSAADAQHIAAEFIGRFMINREALPAIALTTDSSILTAVSNDYCFDDIFKRQVDALCSNKDIVIGISTSGNSNNIIKAFQSAKLKGAKTIALLGKGGGSCKEYADLSFTVPHNESARIQEVHLMIEHIICELVEINLNKK